MPRQAHERGRQQRIGERLRVVEPRLVGAHAAQPGEAGRRVERDPAARPLQEDTLGAARVLRAACARGPAARSAGRGRAPGSRPSRSTSRRRPRTRPATRAGRSSGEPRRASAVRGRPRRERDAAPFAHSHPRLPIPRRGAGDALVEVHPRRVAEQRGGPSRCVKARLFVQKSTRRRWSGGSIPSGTHSASTRSPAHWIGRAGMRKGSTRPPVCLAIERRQLRLRDVARPADQEGLPDGLGPLQGQQEARHEVVDVDGVVEASGRRPTIA